MAKSSTISFEEVMRDLKNKNYHPLYFLWGDEPYYLDKITDYAAANLLTEEEKSFNFTVLYGKEVDARTILGVVKRYPMMASHQVVILKEAQEVKDFKDLVHYFKSPMPTTLFFISYKYKNPDNRISAFKELKKNGVYFESKQLYDNEIPNWISSWLRSKGYKIESKAAVLLNEFLGKELSKISNELEKLIITLPENMKTITADHVEKNIGISKDYNNFELQHALTSRDVEKANRIINYFAKNQKNVPVTLTIISLYFFFSKVLVYHMLNDKSRKNVASSLKINPYFVTDYEKAARSYNASKVVHIISWLREYDLKSKGVKNVSADAGDLLKELVYKILH